MSREVKTVRELELIHHGALIRDSAGVFLERSYDKWYMPGVQTPLDDKYVDLPVTVLWEHDA